MAAEKNSDQPDYFLLGVISLLLAFGILILASVSAPFSQQKFGNTYHFLNHQILYGLIPGLILGFAAFKIKLSLIKKAAPFLFLLSLFLLLMVFLPGIGLKIEGATRWINLGFVSFQPSELLKITFILYLAAWLSSRYQKKEQKEIRTFFVFLAILGLIFLILILQSDASTLGVIFFVGLLMYFVNNTPLFHSIVIVLLGSVGFFSLIKLVPYRANRILVFFNHDFDPMGMGYQLKQSLIAIGSGGITGAGLGMSMPKLFGLLPQPLSDSIFAVFSEELGFIGGVSLILLFLIFFWRGIKITKEAKDRFCQLTALGIVSWIIVQAFVNIGAMIGILPLTGIPLPFIGYGGSALVSSLIGIGILLNISKNV